MSAIWGISALASIGGAVASLVVLTQAMTAQPGVHLFTWHPILMMAAFTLLGPSAAIFVQARKATTNSSTRFGLILAHASLQWTAAACAAGGFYAVYEHKDAKGYGHFTSLHSRVGLAAMGMYAGAMMYAAFRTTTNKNFSMLWSDVMHRIGGVFAVSVGAAAVCTGILHERWTPPNMATQTQQLIAGAAVLGALTVAVGFVMPPGAAAEDTHDKKATKAD
ncbi:hypothetical protein FNF29_04274 [Cafeteria roenbergensis]|uniref:Cytochrome b561 domain-containing protein n=1 Tax=Cafeteria roenbergensis TaxID=33653 RepID=A0A5A8CGF6_CAFRO|nr:hypothetical protein FNF29_04274 [Cafeteria roenbergensis]|eukprot:KAA0151868.1 hypothetical protein FNF29_04274 [Cafeteria roenbergensis]